MSGSTLYNFDIFLSAAGITVAENPRNLSGAEVISKLIDFSRYVATDEDIRARPKWGWYYINVVVTNPTTRKVVFRWSRWSSLKVAFFRDCKGDSPRIRAKLDEIL